jgi:hypothetical protein
MSAAVAGEAKISAAPAPSAEQQLLDLEQEWIKAEGLHDAATLRRILDDQFVHTFGAGEPVGKEEFIRDITSGPLDPTLTQTLSAQTIRVAGDTAIVVETDTIRRIKSGQPVANAYRITVTYIRRDGRWTALAEHMVRVPAGPP